MSQASQGCWSGEGNNTTGSHETASKVLELTTREGEMGVGQAPELRWEGS